MKQFALLTLAFLALTFNACKKDDDKEWASGDKGVFEMEMDSRFGNLDLSLGSEYTTAQGEKVKITKLNYFISNIKLYNADGSVYTVPQNDSYFLVQEEKAGSNVFHLHDVPAGNYDYIEFTVGVDSLRNTLDVSQRTGALDIGGEAADMYWSWNSGYIFFKIEGTSPAAPFNSSLNGNYWWYHIGGFGGLTSATINNIHTYKIKTKGDDDDGEAKEAPLEIRKDTEPHVHFHVDAAKVFDGPTALKIADYPQVMFAPYSVEISKNFEGVFQLNHIHE